MPAANDDPSHLDLERGIGHASAGDDRARTISFREIPTPSPRPVEVLVKISLRIGVCGSDIHVYTRQASHSQNSRSRMGHEVSGKRSPRWGEKRARPAPRVSAVTIEPQGGVRNSANPLPPRQVQPVHEEHQRVDGLSDHRQPRASTIAVDAAKVTPLPTRSDL